MNTEPQNFQLNDAWVSVEDLKVGYYWCRLGPEDDDPTIVKITYESYDGSDDKGLVLWEFESNGWQPLRYYGPPWQFQPVAKPIL